MGPVKCEGIDSNDFQICITMGTDKLVSESGMGVESDLPIAIRAERTRHHCCPFLSWLNFLLLVFLFPRPIVDPVEVERSCANDRQLGITVQASKDLSYLRSGECNSVVAFRTISNQPVSHRFASEILTPEQSVVDNRFSFLRKG